MTAAARKQQQAPVEDAPRLAAVETTEFDATAFRAMARGALLDANSPDPRGAAEKLLAGLTDEQCRVALGVTLPYWIRNFAGTADRQVRQEPAAVASARATMTTPQRINSWYARTLATRILAGDEWKFLRDCTPADLKAAADNRFKAAAATKAEGQKLQRLAVAMEKQGAATVAAVAADELRNIYGAAA